MSVAFTVPIASFRIFINVRSINEKRVVEAISYLYIRSVSSVLIFFLNLYSEFIGENDEEVCVSTTFKCLVNRLEKKKTRVSHETNVKKYFYSLSLAIIILTFKYKRFLRGYVPTV